jgi:hypothetical protein
MFQETVHEQQEQTPQGDNFSEPNPQVLLPNQNTNRDAIKPVRLNSSNIVFLFFARKAIASAHSMIQ